MTWLLGSVAGLASAFWAWHAPAIDMDTPISLEIAQTSSEKSDIQISSLDLNLFAANLWNPPPPEIGPDSEAGNQSNATSLASEQQLLRLQLIGITSENGVLYAALYDQEQDRLLIVRHNDRINHFTVTNVTEDSIEFKMDSGRTHRLVLQDFADIQRDKS